MQELIKDFKEWAVRWEENKGHILSQEPSQKCISKKKYIYIWFPVSNGKRQSKMETEMPLDLATCHSPVVLGRLILGERIGKSVRDTFTMFFYFVS